MGFGGSVTALLETYSNCLKLLKVFNREKGDGDSLTNESLLRKSIRSDRARVHRAYSSRLSESGSRFEKGDGRARSALRRVLKRLTAAIVNLLNNSKTQNPVLDYESLMSLSNASRIDAIKAIDQLSRRLGSTPSRTSVASSSKSSRHRRHHSSSSNASSSTASSSSRSEAKPHKASKSSGEPGRTKTRKSSPKLREEKGKRISHDSSNATHSRSASASSKTAVPNRISLISISTDSTKLGEIPETKRRRRFEYDTSSEEYNIFPMYPLKPYRAPEVKERRFWGLFRR